LLTKFYIFRTKVNEGMVNFEALKNYLKENLILEKNTFLSRTYLQKNTIRTGVPAISLRLYDTTIVDV
jgi:hypothetical protein